MWLQVDHNINYLQESPCSGTALLQAQMREVTESGLIFCTCGWVLSGKGSTAYRMQTDPFGFQAEALLQGLHIAFSVLAAPRQHVHLPAQRGRLLLQLLALLLQLQSGLHRVHTIAAACPAEAHQGCNDYHDQP